MSPLPLSPLRPSQPKGRFASSLVVKTASAFCLSYLAGTLLEVLYLHYIAPPEHSQTAIAKEVATGIAAIDQEIENALKEAKKGKVEETDDFLALARLSAIEKGYSFTEEQEKYLNSIAKSARIIRINLILQREKQISTPSPE